MARKFNPFRATLGATPPVLVGRSDVLEDFALALDEGPGSHERVTLITGARGIGKTVLLNAFENAATERTWWVISETATPGFVNRIRDTAYRRMVGHLREHRQRLSSVTLGGYSLNWENAESHRPDTTLRDVLTEFLDLQRQLDANLRQDPVGLLITLDELHYSVRDEVRDFGATIQHLVREDAEIAVAMAGIPGAIRPLLASNDAQNPVTFLRRANRVELGAVQDVEVELGLVGPVEDIGGRWASDALAVAVSACGGYPFMIQLVGQWSLRFSDGDVVYREAADRGVAKAQRKLGQLVHEPALEDLSDVDRTYLAAMARDDGPSRTAEVATRLGVTAQYANQYRRRLIEAEMIRSVAQGYVEFELPYMRDYLRGHIVNEAFDAVLGEEEQPRIPGL
ncbi:ATP-binding protein [Corynebacterium suedekumii]|uniref:ATP-binding protein n=1 Tax=Corynebacterium suedekumii TaxID=3049801 RepID=A0ABY8VQG9_9CORY|nr:ATP-binding protein [Corynebacterium suedekumii]WIM71035.1 ATP-binding protein [Corynebacterium suedekumii]